MPCPEPLRDDVARCGGGRAFARSGPVNRAWRTLASGACFLLFGVGTLLASSALVLAGALPRVGRERQRRWTLRTLQALARSFIELMQVVGLIRYSIEHAERLALRGRLLVVNHPSLIDALFLIAHAPELCCIVKRDLLVNPCTGPLVRLAGYLANDSDVLIDEASAVLASGRSLLVFPEGTRNGDDLTLDFRRGAAHIAIASRAEVLPVTIDFSPRCLQKGTPWYAVAPQRSTVRVRVLAPIDPVAEVERDRASRVAPCADPLPVTLLARRVTARMRERFVREARSFAAPQGPHR